MLGKVSSFMFSIYVVRDFVESLPCKMRTPCKVSRGEVLNCDLVIVRLSMFSGCYQTTVVVTARGRVFVLRLVAVISSRVFVVSSLSDIFHEKVPRGVLW